MPQSHTRASVLWRLWSRAMRTPLTATEIPKVPIKMKSLQDLLESPAAALPSTGSSSRRVRGRRQPHAATRRRLSKWGRADQAPCSHSPPLRGGRRRLGRDRRAPRGAQLGAGKPRRTATLAPPEPIWLLRRITPLRSVKMFPIDNINIPLVEIRSSSKFSHPITVLAISAASY